MENKPIVTTKLLASEREKADIRAEDVWGRTALSVAAYHGEVTVVRALLQKGAVVDARDYQSWTPLHYTVEGDGFGRNGIEGVPSADHEALIDDYWDGTPIGSYSPGDYTDVARLLIAAGADVNARDDLGRTPLDLALTWSLGAPVCCVPVVQVLLESGAHHRDDRT